MKVREETLIRKPLYHTNLICISYVFLPQDGDLKAVDFDSACAVAGSIAWHEPDVAVRVGCHFGRSHALTTR